MSKSIISIDEIKQLRDEWLGLTLTALVSGVPRRERIDTWCAGLSEPSEDETQRLALALQLLRDVANSEHSRDTARAWFIGRNVGEDLVSPAEAIRAGRFDEARISAQRLIEDVPFSA